LKSTANAQQSLHSGSKVIGAKTQFPDRQAKFVAKVHFLSDWKSLARALGVDHSNCPGGSYGKPSSIRLVGITGAAKAASLKKSENDSSVGHVCLSACWKSRKGGNPGEP
jgi:hypothetical protein